MISPYKILSLRYFSAASLKKSPEEQSYNAAHKHCIQDENNCNTTLGTTHFYLDLEIVIIKHQKLRKYVFSIFWRFGQH